MGWLKVSLYRGTNECVRPIVQVISVYLHRHSKETLLYLEEIIMLSMSMSFNFKIPYFLAKNGLMDMSSIQKIFWIHSSKIKAAMI